MRITGGGGDAKKLRVHRGGLPVFAGVYIFQVQKAERKKKGRRTCNQKMNGGEECWGRTIWDIKCRVGEGWFEGVITHKKPASLDDCVENRTISLLRGGNWARTSTSL